MKFPTPVFMADIARAMNTPPPAQQQPQPADTSRTPGPEPRSNLNPKDVRDPATLKPDVKREAKNERDRLRRKAQRAAALKAAETPKKKVAPPKRKKKTVRIHALTNAAVAPTKKAKRRRGRPPGAKNKPKAAGLAVTLMPVVDTPVARLSMATPAAAMQTTEALAVFGSIVSTLVQHPPGVRNAVLALLSSTFK